MTNIEDKQWPDSKELYMMNGGNKLYIYKEGWGDVYDATAEQEQEWTKEIISKDLEQLDKEENIICLQFAIDNLAFHHYPGLEALLLQKMENTGVKRQVVFATALWKLFKYSKSIGIILRHLATQRPDCIDDVFWGLNEFRNNKEAGFFISLCLEGKDDELFSKAYTTIQMWAYGGLPQLRYDNLLERLAPANRNTKDFEEAIQDFKKMVYKKK